jgi:flagellar biosynthesis/type III secretory pathway M-ring protein FliF/YscJ
MLFYIGTSLSYFGFLCGSFMGAFYWKESIPHTFRNVCPFRNYTSRDFFNFVKAMSLSCSSFWYYTIVSGLIVGFMSLIFPISAPILLFLDSQNKLIDLEDKEEEEDKEEDNNEDKEEEEEEQDNNKEQEAVLEPLLG